MTVVAIGVAATTGLAEETGISVRQIGAQTSVPLLTAEQSRAALKMTAGLVSGVPTIDVLQIGVWMTVALAIGARTTAVPMTGAQTSV